MKEQTTKLIGIASPATCDAPPVLTPESEKLAGPLAEELKALLAVRNGFNAFEGALHVRAAGSDCWGDLNAWNASPGWRDEYRDLAEGGLFFAEDAFGAQFCLHDGAVWTFDPETGAREHLSDTLDGWCGAILADYRVLTGQPLANAWQRANGRLPASHRLIPIVPFVLGGGFDVANLCAVDAERGMRVRANLAAQIRDLPDGAEIRYRLTD